MKVRRFTGMSLGAAAAVIVAVLVVFAWTQFRSGDLSRPASGGGTVSPALASPAPAAEPLAVSYPADAARQAVVERSGSNCIRRASIFFAPNAPLAENDDLSAALAAADGTERWLFPDAAARGARPAWIGGLAGAARAFGGDLVVTGDKVGWIIVDRGDGLVAVELRQRVAASGVAIWWPANEIQSVPCVAE